MRSIAPPPSSRRAGALLIAATLAASRAFAGDALVPGPALLDRPTVTTLGVQLLVSGDDDHDARVDVRYRAAGDVAWRDGLPLWRVRPEVVVGRTVPEQFAGSVFDLAPGTTYELLLHATDPDGPIDVTIALTATTRPVPAADPRDPVPRNVSTASDFRKALTAAAPGDVITLANGTYTGTFSIAASGTAENPIIIRGASTEETVLDGQGCTPCNVLQASGSFVHVERLTLRNGDRALRFLGTGARGNVVRRMRIENVRLGIGANADQRDFYLCDNTLTGRLAWPLVYSDDAGAHANDDGIRVEGNGHVVCHNDIVGFGDPMKTSQAGARAVDFYGNEVRSAYDDGLELDFSEGNTRAFRNRFTNTYDTISFQPVYGGPVYALRNVIVNVAKEPFKLHAYGTSPPQEPSGMLVLHNTVVKADAPLTLLTSAASHFFLLANNVFVGPGGVPRVVQWSAPIDHGTIDFDGWFPDGRFDFRPNGDWPSFAAMQAAGLFESHGVLLTTGTFASGLLAPTDYRPTLAPADATLAGATPALDRAALLPNLNDVFTGAGPDLGALERDCPAPVYGVRPEGVDETDEPRGCDGPTFTTTTTTVPGTSTTTTTLPWVLVGTRSLALRDGTLGGGPARRKVSFSAGSRLDPPGNRIIAPAPGSTGDPTVAGATLKLYDTAGSGEAVTVTLPARDPLTGAGWLLLGSPEQPRGWSFRSRAAGDPIARVLVKNDHLTLKGGGSGWSYTLDEPSQGRIALRLTLGAGRPWCTEDSALGPETDRVDLFKAAPRTPPPATCPPLP